MYALGAGRVAKVWGGRPASGLLGRVYADLARYRLPFATPEFLAVEEYAGAVVTYERELPGVPLRADSAGEDFARVVPVVQRRALLAVLRGLASVPGTEAMRELTVRGDDRSLWQGQERFQEAVAALVLRAVARHGAALAARLPDFEAGVARTVRALRSLPDAAVTVLHGDLVPPNIHVDAAVRPVAVLDFGFWTTAGDPAFEAAVAAAVWDMYGPYAEEHVRELTGFFAGELGHPPATLAVYQAAYALTTYDLFGVDDSDGHFRWCVTRLRRSPVFSARPH